LSVSGTGRLAGRNAVVTGAGRGIGAAIAFELAERGASVAVTDVDLEAAEAVLGTIVERGGTGVALRCDVSDKESVSTAASEAQAAIGQLSIWVSNAGVSTMACFEDITIDEWQHMFDVNTTGVFLCGQEAARRFGGGGVIVNVASMAGKQGRVPFLAHYVASKFAVVGLTQAMAYELGPRGIRVNAVCPGYVSTSMQQRELEWEAALRSTGTEAVRALMIGDTPLGRLEVPEDVASVVGFLCDDESRFVTGEAVAVNGGAYMD